MFTIPVFLIAIAAQQASPVAPSQPQCAAIDASLPDTLAGWSTTGTGMALDRAFRVSATGGEAVVAFRVTTPGRYRVALDQPGWIDLLRDGKSIESVGHGHGPDCTTIRKIVDFDLAPGQHSIKLTKLVKPQARLMLIAPTPKR